jgi:hypothetical protein
MPETVDDVTQTVRDLVNDPRRLALLIRDEPAAFSQVCSAMDALGEDESLHRLANRASIWSSVSSSITRPAATSS